MSVSFLNLIPIKPNFVPSGPMQEKGKVFLKNIFLGEETEFITTDGIEFIDQGENFKNVSCNLCNQIIEIEFWQTQMNKCYEKHFNDLAFTTECCKKQTTLNDLIYNSPAGFGRFVIKIRNPEKDMDVKQIKELEVILGVNIRQIWAHY